MCGFVCLNMLNPTLEVRLVVDPSVKQGRIDRERSSTSFVRHYFVILSTLSLYRCIIQEPRSQ